MAIIKIDTSKELPPQKYADKKGVTKQVVTNWLKRGKVKSRYIEELDLRLIKVD